jgi:hypothetical protein
VTFDAFPVAPAAPEADSGGDSMREREDGERQ